jgi:hypothetical protein
MPEGQTDCHVLRAHWQEDAAGRARSEPQTARASSATKSRREGIQVVQNRDKQALDSSNVTGEGHAGDFKSR